MDALFRTEVAHDALIREAQRALAHLVTISLHSAERSADRWRAVVAADYSNIDMEPPLVSAAQPASASVPASAPALASADRAQVMWRQGYEASERQRAAHDGGGSSTSAAASASAASAPAEASASASASAPATAAAARQHQESAMRRQAQVWQAQLSVYSRDAELLIQGMRQQHVNELPHLIQEIQARQQHVNKLPHRIQEIRTRRIQEAELVVDPSEMMGQDDGTKEMDDDYGMELGEDDGSDAHNPEAEAIILASNVIRERELALTVHARVNEERGGVRDAQQSERSRLTARPTAKRDGGRRKKSTSRLRGVSWDKGSKKWQARITIGGEEKRLGMFVDEADAGRAFDGAAIANNLDRPLNFPAPGPGGAASSAVAVEQSERSRLTARPTAKRAGGKRRKKSTSRLRGVNWDKGSKKWQARITIGGKEKRLGRFVDEADAGRAFDGAVIANNLNRPLNFPAPGPGGAASSAAVVAVPSKKIVQLWRQRVHAPVRVRWNRVWYDAWIGDSELEFTDEKGSRNRKVKAGFVRVRFMGGSYCDVRDDARSVQERLAATSRVDEGEQLQPLLQPHAAELAVDASDEDMDDDDGMVWGADDSSDDEWARAQSEDQRGVPVSSAAPAQPSSAALALAIETAVAMAAEARRGASSATREAFSASRIVCAVCGSGEQEASLMLCGNGLRGCDRGFHTTCLTPALAAVPLGDWFCPGCTGQGVAGEVDVAEVDNGSARAALDQTKETQIAFIRDLVASSSVSDSVLRMKLKDLAISQQARISYIAAHSHHGASLSWLHNHITELDAMNLQVNHIVRHRASFKSDDIDQAGVSGDDDDDDDDDNAADDDEEGCGSGSSSGSSIPSLDDEDVHGDELLSGGTSLNVAGYPFCHLRMSVPAVAAAAAAAPAPAKFGASNLATHESSCKRNPKGVKPKQAYAAEIAVDASDEDMDDDDGMDWGEYDGSDATARDGAVGAGATASASAAANSMGAGAITKQEKKKSLPPLPPPPPPQAWTLVKPNALASFVRSEFSGVLWDPSKRKWRATIHIDKTRTTSAYYDDEIAAARAYDASAIANGLMFTNFERRDDSGGGEEEEEEEDSDGERSADGAATVVELASKPRRKRARFEHTGEREVGEARSR